VDAQDPELPSLLRCSVPVVISDSKLVGKAVETWNFDYLDRHLSDVDNFYVLCAPAKSRGRFAYYDMSAKKNPCGYKILPTNERVEMRFPDFRRKVTHARKKGMTGKNASSYYLQNALLHKDDKEPGPPRPVGGFGVSCGYQVANDITDFRWSWLKQMMGGRDVSMTQFFCGLEGAFSPCHYDPQDNAFAQVRGYKRVLLLHPRHFGSLYPWPVHHPQDRQSRVDFDAPDLKAFPRYAELMGHGLEVVVGPGDILRIPPGWWHHIEMLPSPPDGEVVSINFWYTPPTWYIGDPEAGDISWDRPLFGIRRVLFQRCIEELIAQTQDPSKVQEVVRICAGRSPWPSPGAPILVAVEHVLTFVRTIFTDTADQNAIFLEIIEGRFQGLTPGGAMASA
jgi:hypoxia-inducible factor 1-alpha inhibitor (HIF hydroxylase)